MNEEFSFDDELKLHTERVSSTHAEKRKARTKFVGGRRFGGDERPKEQSRDAYSSKSKKYHVQ